MLISYIGRSSSDHVISHTSSPALLSICQDSRRAVLKRYEPLIVDDVHTGAVINWAQDTLFLNAVTLSLNLMAKLDNSIVYEKCRILMMGREFFYTFAFAGTNLWRREQSIFSSKFHTVEQLLVVLETGDPNEHEHGQNPSDKLVRSIRQDGGKFIHIRLIRCFEEVFCIATSSFTRTRSCY